MFACSKVSRLTLKDSLARPFADPPPNLPVAVEMPDLPAAGEVDSAPLEKPGKPVKKAGAKSSPYRGVTLFRPTMKWRAQVSHKANDTSSACKTEGIYALGQLPDQ